MFDFQSKHKLFANGFYQIGYVVPDLDKAQAYFTDHMGVPGFYVMRDAIILDQTYLGQASDTHQHIAFGYAGNFNLELIQPVSGTSTYSKYLNLHPGGGVHHIGIKVYDHDAAIADAKALGYQVLQSGRFGKATKFSYLDTDKDIGHYTEIFFFDTETEQLFDNIRNGRI